MKLLSAHEVGEILLADKTRIEELARKGELPGAKIGRNWVFTEEDVEAFVRNEIVKQTEARRSLKTMPKRNRRELPKLQMV